jgi:DNA polymerase sigma
MSRGGVNLLASFENTDIDKKYLKNYPYVKSVINGSYDSNGMVENNEYLLNLDKQIQQFIHDQKITKPLINRRNGIIKHLRKILTNKFQNSKLSSFGSFESGLSLSFGDIDLCLEFDGDAPKKVLKKIAHMLNEDGMKDVNLITNAKVPIVKCIDGQSMIPVDISVNNNLSVYNTELLKRYSDLDPRVRPFIMAVKYWARNRGVCQPTSGTFSSYAWTLIAINVLQTMENPVVPNLCSRDGSEKVTIGGKVFDVSIKETKDIQFVSNNKNTVSELISKFFCYLALNWPWNSSIMSVGTGTLLPRKQKNWEHQKPFTNNAIQDKKIVRLGKHSLPVEDPFDELHDLSVVLDAEGVFEIRDEVLRAHSLIHDSKDWDSICEIKYPELSYGTPQLDLFEDLRSKDTSEIKNELEQLYSALNVVEKSVSVRESERNDAIRMSKALRKNAELAREQSTLASELRPRRSKINEIQSKRDLSNNNYIPVHFIEEELLRVYQTLSQESPSGLELSFEKEKSLFSWFFELQSMHEHAKLTRNYHREFLKLVNQQEQSVEQIKDLRHEIISVNSFGKFTDFDDLAKRLLIELNPLKKERRKLRREIGRLEAWLRKQNYTAKTRTSNKHTSNRRIREKGNVNQVKNKVISGDSFSLQDLDLLLKNGGINSVSKGHSDGKKSNKKSKKSKTSFQPHRGKRGKSAKNNQ